MVECLDEDENYYVNHMLWLSCSPDQTFKKLMRGFRAKFSMGPSLKNQIRGIAVFLSSRDRSDLCLGTLKLAWKLVMAQHFILVFHFIPFYKYELLCLYLFPTEILIGFERFKSYCQKEIQSKAQNMAT